MTDAQIIENATDTDIAEWLRERLSAALGRTPGTVAIAVPGGSTPFPILERLVARPLDWPRIRAYPTDDRLVSEDHPASNTGRLRALLEPVGAAVASLGDGSDPGTGAGIPQFALVWLGMGADGHVASLFPNTDPQADDREPVRRLTPDPLPPEAPFDRITLTLPALLATQDLLFVIRGADKRAVFEAALRGDHDLPVARLLAASGQGRDRKVTCFV